MSWQLANVRRLYASTAYERAEDAAACAGDEDARVLRVARELVRDVYFCNQQLRTKATHEMALAARRMWHAVACDPEPRARVRECYGAFAALLLTLADGQGAGDAPLPRGQRGDAPEL